jgi:hypothetical protein
MRLNDEQLGAALTALRPTPTERFAAELDQRAAGGFPAAERDPEDTVALRALTSLRRLRWRVWAPVAATAGLAVLVAVIAIGGNETRPTGQLLSEPQGATDQAGKIAAPNAAEPQAIAPEGAPGSSVEAAPPFEPVPPNGTAPRNGRAQVQELSAALGLTTAADEVGDAADGVVDTTNRYEGFVDSSDVHLGGADAHAFFTLRIPAEHLRDALDDLSELGKVVSRDEGSTNVTGAYVDAGQRFHDAKAKVDSLLEDLRKASSPSEADAIRQQLAAARQELAAARAALGDVKQRVTYAPVTVQVKAADAHSGWSIGDAVDDAGDVIVAIAGAALIALAVLVPLTALIALGLLGARKLQRRHRESALND